MKKKKKKKKKYGNGMHPTIQHISTGAAGDPGAAALGIHRHDTITTSDVRPKYYCGERERERARE